MSKGAYRSSYEALVDDADYQDLTPLAQAVFHTLKLKLGQYGIAVFYLSTLEQIHQRAHRAEIATVIEELEHTKPSGAPGWLVREKNVLWLRNGLMFEPYYAPNNDKQRKGALAFALTLPKLQIVRDFAAHYALPMPSASPADATQIPPRSRETETEPERDTETEPESGKDSEVIHNPVHISTIRAVEGSPANSPPLSVANEKPDSKTARAVKDFLGHFYAAASHRRKDDVHGQLAGVLTPSGAPFEGSRVRAVDGLHLRTTLLDVTARPPKDRNAAIVFVLQQLRDTYLEELSKRHKEPPRKASDGSRTEPVRIGDVVAGMQV